MKYKIYVIEDDLSIGNIILSELNKWGYEAYLAKDFSSILQEFADVNPHLVIMDIILPRFDGYYWCTKIREISKVPVIFVSSKETNMDVVMAMNVGGDDYIQKPFSIDILIAKIQAVIRRSYDYSESSSNLLVHDDIILKTDDSTLIYQDEIIELTKNECRIMSVLLSQPDKIVSREKMMRKLWEHESFVDDNTLTVNINRLRKKLAGIGLPDLIYTKKGQGYMIK